MTRRRCSSAPARRLIVLFLSACCLLATGCGASSAPPKPVADRICGGARDAAARLGYPVKSRIVAPDPSDLQCVLTGRRLVVHVGSQATTQAYMEFDTETSHQSQVYGPGIHEPGQIPVQTSIPGAVVAVWIRAQKEIVATNASPTTSGTYVTVTVAGRSAQGASALRLAQAVARATFAAHPDAS